MHSTCTCTAAAAFHTHHRAQRRPLFSDRPDTCIPKTSEPLQPHCTPSVKAHRRGCAGAAQHTAAVPVPAHAHQGLTDFCYRRDYADIQLPLGAPPPPCTLPPLHTAKMPVRAPESCQGYDGRRRAAAAVHTATAPVCAPGSCQGYHGCRRAAAAAAFCDNAGACARVMPGLSWPQTRRCRRCTLRQRQCVRHGHARVTTAADAPPPPCI